MAVDTIFNYPLVTTVIAGLLLLGVAGKFLKLSFRQISKWYLYASVFAVVVVMNSIFFPFIGGKDFFFRFTTELALIAFMLWWGFEARPGETRELFRTAFKKPLVRAVSIFIFVVMLASIFAFDANAAFWSNFERGEGGFQMLHYYIFFLLLVVLLREEKDWKNLFRFSLIAAGLMIIYGLLGNFMVSGYIGPYSGGGTAPTGWWHALIDGRFQGSLGNPAYVAPYLMFAMFYAAYLWIGEKLSGTAAKFTSWLYGALIAIFLFFFILTQTRGAFLGLGASIFALLVYFAFAGTAKIRKWSAAVAVLLIVLGIGLYSVRNTTFVQNLPEGRLLQISLSSDSAQTRLWVWNEAWKGFLERPILGWGPENFPAVFDKYFDPRFYVPGQNTETWFDRAHSIIFDYLSEIGILGFLAYAAIFVILFWEFFRRRELHKQGGKGTLTLQRGMIFALPVAYLVQGIAIFDVFPMYLSLFLFFAFATYYFSTTHNNRA